MKPLVLEDLLPTTDIPREEERKNITQEQNRILYILSMMRLHKLYHRFTLLPFSPLSIPSNPSLLPLALPPRLTLRLRTAANFSSMASSRLRNLAPLAAEDSAASFSSSASAATSVDYEGQFSNHFFATVFCSYPQNYVLLFFPLTVFRFRKRRC